VRTCPARDDIIGGIAATTKAYYLYGWIMLHPSGAYVTFTQAEAESAVIAVYATAMTGIVNSISMIEL